MKTSNTFNLRRFCNLVAADAKSIITGNGLSMLIISLMGVIIYIGTVIMGLVFNGEWSAPEIGFRVVTFVISMAVLIITTPVKCYGNITEKQFGSRWLMLPASKFEKFLSMILMTVIAVPISVAAVYLCTDALLCSLDPTAGASLISSAKEFMAQLIDAEMTIKTSMEMGIGNEDFAHLLSQLTNPWLYVDDLIGSILVFLLGALLFRTGKTVKTIIALIGISILTGLIATPIANEYLQSGTFWEMGIFQHAALYDTINDQIIVWACLGAIYWRIKTLTH